MLISDGLWWKVMFIAWAVKSVNDNFSYFGWFLMKSQKLHFRTEVKYGSMKCLKLLLCLNFLWTWIHLPITSTFAWDIRIINNFTYIVDCLHLDNCMKHIFFVISDTPDPVGNGGTGDTGETFNQFFCPENRNRNITLVKVQQINMKGLQKLNWFIMWYFQKATKKEKEAIKKMWQNVFVTAGVINSTGGVDVDAFSDFLQNALIHR